MSIIRPFDATDLLKINNINTDAWTETYRASFYLDYCATWPDFSCVVEEPQDGRLVAYLIGKHEPPAPHPQHHGHITALSIHPSHRSLGLANKLVQFIEERSGPGGGVDSQFVDLFVRCCNERAVGMYEKMGYSVYRRVVGYYHGMESMTPGKQPGPDETDGFDMRKSMPRDSDHKHIRQNGKQVRVSPQEVWQ